MLKKCFIGIVFLLMIALVACSSRVNNDGHAVSERIVKSAKVDSMLIAKELASLDSLIMPEIFGRDMGKVLVELVECGSSFCASDLNKKISLVRTISALREGEKYSARFAEGVQSYIDDLQPERRMKIYIAIATPEQIGTALRIDRYNADGDTTLIVSQKKMLRTMYTDDEWLRFIYYYNK